VVASQLRVVRCASSSVAGFTKNGTSKANYPSVTGGELARLLKHLCDEQSLVVAEEVLDDLKLFLKPINAEAFKLCL
jgi:hypothetical protein